MPRAPDQWRQKPQHCERDRVQADETDEDADEPVESPSRNARCKPQQAAEGGSSAQAGHLTTALEGRRKHPAFAASDLGPQVVRKARVEEPPGESGDPDADQGEQVVRSIERARLRVALLRAPRPILTA